MPAIPRQTILDRFQQMIAAGQPIIGGGAGTGLSAKAEEAGGIDLIIIYNSGRYRMAGRGSAAGLLAYGNANEIVKEMAVEVLPVVKHTPVLAGVNGTDPFMLMPQFLAELKAWAFPACRTSRPSACLTARCGKALKRRAWGSGWRST
jgi:predicted TIM-barrel enzyme